MPCFPTLSPGHQPVCRWPHPCMHTRLWGAVWVVSTLLRPSTLPLPASTLALQLALAMAPDAVSVGAALAGGCWA